jgi:hypothetical protein
MTVIRLDDATLAVLKAATGPVYFAGDDGEPVIVCHPHLAPRTTEREEGGIKSRLNGWPRCSNASARPPETDPKRPTRRWTRG